MTFFQTFRTSRRLTLLSAYYTPPILRNFFFIFQTHTSKSLHCIPVPLSTRSGMIWTTR